jgi:hypothetical protein
MPSRGATGTQSGKEVLYPALPLRLSRCPSRVLHPLYQRIESVIIWLWHRRQSRHSNIRHFWQLRRWWRWRRRRCCWSSRHNYRRTSDIRLWSLAWRCSCRWFWYYSRSWPLCTEQCPSHVIALHCNRRRRISRRRWKCVIIWSTISTCLCRRRRVARPQNRYSRDFRRECSCNRRSCWRWHRWLSSSWRPRWQGTSAWRPSSRVCRHSRCNNRLSQLITRHPAHSRHQ